MPSWHLPHVAGTVVRNTGLAGSVRRLMSCASWQSLQLGADHQAALAERLAVDAVLELRDDVADRRSGPCLMISAFPWQRPQVAGRFRW